MLKFLIPLIITTVIAPKMYAQEKADAMTCESAEVLPATQVPVVTLVAPKIYRDNAPVVLLTVRNSMSDIPTGYTCKIARLVNGGSELMDFSCVSQNGGTQHLKVYVSKSSRIWVANLLHRSANGEQHEINNLACKPYAPRVTRPY